MYRKNAFTLIELLIVIVIIGVLVGLVAPALLSSKNNAKIQRRDTDKTTLAAAAWNYRHEYGRWPCSKEPTGDPNKDDDDLTVDQSDFLTHMKDNADKNNPRQVHFVNWSDYITDDVTGYVIDPVSRAPYGIGLNFAADKMWFINGYTN